jgi:uncharacterized protein with von Willebrand factor type A (vWA) domain
VARRVKDYIEISEFTSLDRLIAYLQTIRDTLPPDAEAEMKVRGDETFGRRLTISYFRELSAEEEECEARYSAVGLLADDPKIDELARRLNGIA